MSPLHMQRRTLLRLGTIAAVTLPARFVLGQEAAKPFVHPGLLHSREELAFVKQQIAAGIEPWKSAWEQLRSSSSAALDHTARPRAEVVRGPYNDPDIGGSEFSRDSAAADNRLAVGFEYTAKYNLGHVVPYESYRSFEGKYHYQSISSDSRGRFPPIYERIVYHYHGRKGLEMPYCREAVAKSRSGRRGGGSHVPWGALLFAIPRGPD